MSLTRFLNDISYNITSENGLKLANSLQFTCADDKASVEICKDILAVSGSYSTYAFISAEDVRMCDI